jgi:hypothetical protein
MKVVGAVFAAVLLTASAPARETKTYTGVITDTMCGREHASMKIDPLPKCVRECVGDGKTYKYALMTTDAVYTLSDQETPATFAGETVVVSGVLYTKTNILKVNTIRRAR